MEKWSIPEPPKDVQEYLEQHPGGPVAARIGNNDVSVYVIPVQPIGLQDWERQAVNVGLEDLEAERTEPYETTSLLKELHTQHKQRT